MAFWNDPIVERSHAILLDLKGQFDFTLIGGWAVYLYTRALKSKDIDLIVDHATLSRMMGTMSVSKNARLRKYESDAGGVSIDIYLPHYSKLAVPPEDIQKATTVIDGFRVPALEMLLAMKQLAELERRASVKGMKDRVDILSILLCGGVDTGKYARLLQKYRLDYLDRLRTIVVEANDEFDYLGFKDLREVKKKRKALLEKIEAGRG
jgi:hypothetical protein